jgi:hypothetical protein
MKEILYIPDDYKGPAILVRDGCDLHEWAENQRGHLLAKRKGADYVLFVTRRLNDSYGSEDKGDDPWYTADVHGVYEHTWEELLQDHDLYCVTEQELLGLLNK